MRSKSTQLQPAALLPTRTATNWTANNAGEVVGTCNRKAQTTYRPHG